MANYATLISAIQNVIKTNGNNAITGALLQQSLLSMINSLGAEYQFVGRATPSTVPGTPDHNVAYIGGAGTYPNFGVTVPDGAICILKYNGSWIAETIQVVGDDILRASVDRTDLLFGLEYTDGVFINPSTGETQNLASFFSYFEIPIPSGLTTLWPYCSYPTTTNCARSIIFLDSNKNYISGISGNTDYYQNGVTIPANAAYFSVCFAKPTLTTFPDSYYLATEQGAPVYKYLSNDVYVRYQNIINAPTIPTKTSDLQNDSGFVTADGVATVTTENTNIIDETKRINNRFLTPSTGELSTNSSFFTFQYLPIPSGVSKLWPYCSYPTTTNCARSVAFYDSAQQYISGVSGTLSYYQNGINVPQNAAFVSVCYAKPTQTTYPDSYYLATEQGAPVHKTLQTDIKVDYNSLINVPETRPRIRLYPKTKLPCISLQFDDCNLSGDQTVVEYMDSVGCVCDFAFMAAAAYFGENSRASQYLAWNKRGYGIQNHSINGNIFNETNYNYSTALAAIMTARTRLENAGMVVNGFVCPSSEIADSFRPILALQGAYAFTTSTSSPTANPRTADPCDLHRYSMQSHTLAEIKTFIDDCIANDQIITLYGHTADFGTTYSDVWNLAKVQSIVEYIIQKRDAGLVYFNNTDNCVKNYFGL